MKDAQKVVDFESKIARVQKPTAEQRNYMQQYNRYTFDNAQTRWANLGVLTFVHCEKNFIIAKINPADLSTYFNVLLKNIPGGFDVLKTHGFIVMFPSYMDGLDGALYTVVRFHFSNCGSK